jgi:hypothetical protein
MSVVAFDRNLPRGAWAQAERDAMSGLLRAVVRHGGSWEIGVTEPGDPQLYLLGPERDGVCVGCVSRIGRRYILEDGEGRLVSEHASLAVVAQHARVLLPAARTGAVARLLAMWIAVRQFVHEKVEPLLAEGEELIVEVAPHLTLLA